MTHSRTKQALSLTSSCYTEYNLEDLGSINACRDSLPSCLSQPSSHAQMRLQLAAYETPEGSREVFSGCHVHELGGRGGGVGLCYLVDGEIMPSQHAAQLGLCEVVTAALRLLHYAGLDVIRLLALHLHIPARHVPTSAHHSSFASIQVIEGLQLCQRRMECAHSPGPQ